MGLGLHAPDDLDANFQNDRSPHGGVAPFNSSNAIIPDASGRTIVQV